MSLRTLGLSFKKRLALKVRKKKRDREKWLFLRSIALSEFPLSRAFSADVF
jgi:hypothetical protein